VDTSTRFKINIFKDYIQLLEGAMWIDFGRSQGAKCGGATVCINVGYPTTFLQDHDEEPGLGVHFATLHKNPLLGCGR
jgi:hypothetical protein